MGRICLAALAAAAFVLSSPSAHAYTPTLTPDGKPVRWHQAARLALAGNPVNKSGLSDAAFFDSVIRGLQRWKAASDGKVTFDYWQGRDPAIYEPSDAYDGLSAIFFVSNSKSPNALSSNVLGLTQVWYDTSTGQILEIDIALNDQNYRFTQNPRDTSGYGARNSPSGESRHVYIENVITHELGHAYGLSHSGGLQSTMLFMESPEQAHLGCDEQVGIRAIYSGSSEGSRGAITGTVRAEGSGAPVFGAHVVAISRRRGTVLATALTDKAGRYSIGALEPGGYFLMLEPFFAGSAALPSYYSSLNTSLCSGQSFSRAVLTSSENRPAEIHVGAGGSVEAPPMAARCGQTRGASVPASLSSSRFSSAPVIYDGTTGDAVAGGFGVADRFGSASGSSSLYYRLRAVRGRLEVHAMSYSLYSPVQPRLQLLDAAGFPVETELAEKVYLGASGYVNYDSALVAKELRSGDYIVQVTSSPLSTSDYPAGPVSLDSVPFLLVTGSVNEPEPALAASLPFNARCRMEESFPPYSSPPGNPERDTEGRAPKEKDGTGFCGTVQAMGGRGGGASPGSGAIAGWLLPWAVMLAMARLAVRSARWGELRIRRVAVNL